MGIGPTYSAWKADALPLSYTRNANANLLDLIRICKYYLLKILARRHLEAVFFRQIASGGGTLVCTPIERYAGKLLSIFNYLLTNVCENALV